MPIRKDKIIPIDIDGCVLDWEEGSGVGWNTHVDGYTKYSIGDRYGLRKNKVIRWLGSLTKVPKLDFCPYYVMHSITPLLHEKHRYRR